MASKALDALINALAGLGIQVQAVETPLPTPIPTPPPTPNPIPAGIGRFQVKGGWIIGPDGKAFVPVGINVHDGQMNEVCRNDACEPLLTLFPGLNIVRFNCYNYSDVKTYDTFVSRLTKKGIVVLFDDHTGISKPPYTGQQLANEVDWFKRVADHYKDNTYVWINGFNEPGDGNNLPGITAQQVAIYNTIRTVSPYVINVLELPSGGNPGLVGTAGKGYDGSGPMPSSAYASMYNIVWGPHYYGWMSKYSTDRATVQSAFMGSVSSASGILAVQSIQSADGVVPVVIGEFGDSTTGDQIDANGTVVVDVVGNSGYGFIAWHWNASVNPGDLLTHNGALTPYGKQIAALIAKASGSVATPTPTDASILTPGDGKTLTDARGIKWSIDNAGAVLSNGVAVPGGGGTSQLSLDRGVAVAVDKATGSRYTWNGSAWITYPTSVSTTPLPIPTPTPTSGNGSSPGAWLSGAFGGMQYKTLLPDGYDATVSYPCILYLHQLDWGISSNEGMLMQSLNAWFNSPAFRAAHKVIIVAPQLDQSADKSGVTINFGGVSSSVTAGRDAVLKVLQSVMNSYNVDKRRTSVTGNSLGGIGSWELIAFRPDLFCAAMPLAGANYCRDVNTTAAALKDKPIWSIHGSNDTNVPLSWDRAMSAQMQSIGGKLKYTEMAGYGHDVWDTIYSDPQYIGWLLSQSM